MYINTFNKFISLTIYIVLMTWCYHSFLIETTYYGFQAANPSDHYKLSVFGTRRNP